MLLVFTQLLYQYFMRGWSFPSWRVKESQGWKCMPSIAHVKVRQRSKQWIMLSILKLQIFHRTYLYLFMWNTDLPESPIFYWATYPCLWKEVKMEEEGLVCSVLSIWTAISITVKANADLGHPILVFVLLF